MKDAERRAEFVFKKWFSENRINRNILNYRVPLTE